MTEATEGSANGAVYEEISTLAPFTVQLAYRQKSRSMLSYDEGSRQVYVRISPAVQLGTSLVSDQGEYTAELYGATGSSACFVFRAKKDNDLILLERFRRYLHDLLLSLAAINNGGETLLELVD